MRIRKASTTVAIISTTALVALLVHGALAGTETAQPVSGKAISAVRVVSDSTRQTFGGPGIGVLPWTDLPGASTSISVPTSWHSALLILRFQTTVYFCYARCNARMLVDGVESNPVIPVPFDDNLIGGVSGGGSSQGIERSLVVGPGAHQVTVQVDGPYDAHGAVQLTLGEWILTVERARAS